MNLNDEQYRAITASSPALINAAAGSGKTRCLTAKIQQLLDAGVPAHEICAVTFTNKAAKEMKDRLKERHNITGMQVSTIHSMCVGIIKAFPQHTYLRVPFSIYDDADQLSIVRTVLKSRNMQDNPSEVLSLISNAKCRDRKPVDLDAVYEAYQAILKSNNAADFDDLLILAKRCLEQNDCRDTYTQRWPHILVDEFQDTSRIQYDIILSIYRPGMTKTFFVVGDFNQSIYKFRGAQPENITAFIRDYQPTVCDLTYNYRSCPQIITQANHFLQFGKPMVAKSQDTGVVSMTEFASHHDEAERIARSLLNVRSLESTAILFRMNARSALFEEFFAKYRIPYRVVGALPFYKRRVVKDLLCALKAANNASDIESLKRIINNPKRGFGDRKQEQLLLHGRSYIDEVPSLVIKRFMSLLDRMKGLPPLQATVLYLNESGYTETLKTDDDRDLVDAFRNVVASYPSVDELLLAATFLEEDSGSGIQLMTAHAAKGLEFDRVFVVGLEQGVWPHARSEDLEEEERLLYVAVTRARRWLNVSFSRTKPFRGAVEPVSASPFFARFYQSLHGKPYRR